MVCSTLTIVLIISLFLVCSIFLFLTTLALRIPPLESLVQGSPSRWSEIHRFQTTDGLELFLLRLAPEGKSIYPPVLMLHGTGMSFENFDIEGCFSPARTLQHAGLDVWLLTLRVAQEQSHAWDDTPARLGFHEMVSIDLPEAMAYVMAKTISPCVNLLGFSLGGMISYAMFEEREVPCKKLVTIGSPGLLNRQLLLKILPTAYLPNALPFRRLTPSLPLRWLSLIIPHFFLPYFLNAKNLHLLKPFLKSMRNVPGALGWDLLQYSKKTSLFFLEPGRATELLAIASEADNIGTVKSVHAAYHAWKGPKKMLCLGKKHGHSVDYGHGDLCLSDHSKEWFGEVVDFFKKT